MKLLTLARDLRRRKARERQGLFVAEGVRAVEELLASELEVRGLLLTARAASDARVAGLADAAAARGSPVATVSDEELRSAADTESPQGILAVGRPPELSLGSLQLGPTARLVVLDALQDPGNAGTILRTAAALGAAATLALPGTVDLWNAKVVRSSMGAHFRHPAITCTTDELLAFLEGHSIALWAADMDGEPLGAREAPDRLALAIGNEGAGIGAGVRQAAERRVTIPIAGGVESLNAAVATGILLHSLRA